MKIRELKEIIKNIDDNTPVQVRWINISSAMLGMIWWDKALSFGIDKDWLIIDKWWIVWDIK